MRRIAVFVNGMPAFGSGQAAHLIAAGASG
jgi:hypothetical protein